MRKMFWLGFIKPPRIWTNFCSRWSILPLSSLLVSLSVFFCSNNWHILFEFQITNFVFHFFLWSWVLNCFKYFLFSFLFPVNIRRILSQTYLFPIENKLVELSRVWLSVVLLIMQIIIILQIFKPSVCSQPNCISFQSDEVNLHTDL